MLRYEGGGTECGSGFTLRRPQRHWLLSCLRVRSFGFSRCAVPFFSCVRGGVGCVRARLGCVHVRVAQFRCWCAARPRQVKRTSHRFRAGSGFCWLRFEVGFARHPRQRTSLVTLHCDHERPNGRGSTKPGLSRHYSTTSLTAETRLACVADLGGPKWRTRSLRGC